MRNVRYSFVNIFVRGSDIIMKCSSLVGVVIGCVAFLYVGGLILAEVSKYQGEPYMDEIFHIRQAQKYCVGRYSEVKNGWRYFPSVRTEIYTHIIIIIIR